MSVSSTSIPVTWTPPVNGTPPFTYTLQYRVHGSTLWQTFGTPTTNLSLTLAGLEHNTSYDLQIITTNSAGSFTSPIITSSTADGQAPSVASSLVANNITTNSLTLSWTAPLVGTTPLTYIPQYRLANTTTWTQLAPTIGNATQTTISGLLPNTAYEFSVITQNDYGSSLSSVYTATTNATLYTLINNLSVGTVTSSSVSLSWTAPSGGTPPLTYTVQYRVSGTTAWTTYLSGVTINLLTVAGLGPSTQYDFSVITSNAAGSTLSNIVQGSTLAAAIVTPTAATNLAAGLIGATSIQLTWTASVSGDAPVYTVQYRITGDLQWQNYNITTTSTALTLNKLQPNTSYDFCVVASNSGGSSTSTTFTASTISNSVNLPGAIASITSTIQPTTIILNWSTPNSGTTPFNYQPQYRLSGNNNWQNIGTLIQQTTATVNNLLPNTAYDFQIIASNAAGSSMSATVTFITAQYLQTQNSISGQQTSGSSLPIITGPAIVTVPACGSITIPNITNYDVSSGNGHSICTLTCSNGTLTLMSVSNPIAGSGTNSITVNSLLRNLNTLLTTLVYTANNAATADTISINITNSMGNSNTLNIPVIVLTMDGSPSSVLNLTVASVGSVSATLTWTTPLAGNAPILYIVQYQAISDSNWSSLAPITDTTATVGGLNATTTYNFRVIASNNFGRNISTLVTATTAIAATLAPTSPTNVAIGVITGNSIQLGWTTSSAGSTPIVYNVQYRPVGSNTWLNAQTTASNNYVVTNLATNTTYNFQVIASNSAGFSNSATVTATTQATTLTGVPTDAKGITAFSAQAFLNSCGVNISLDTNSSNLIQIQNSLLYLHGLKVVRDAIHNNDFSSSWWQQIALACGVKFIGYIPEEDASKFGTTLNYLLSLASIPRSCLLMIEGCEEADTGQVLGYNETVTQAASFQATVYNDVKQVNPNLPVMQISFGQGWTSTTGNYNTVGNLTNWADYGNAHITSAANPSYGYANGTFAFLMSCAQLPTTGKPIIISEFGWPTGIGSSPGSGYGQVSYNTQAAYVLEGFLDAFKLNAAYMCYNTLVDTSTSTNGLFDVNFNAKPAAIALRNLFLLLTDNNSAALDFVPGTLDYNISGMPTNSNPNMGGQQLLFQKSDGTYELILWNEQQLNIVNGSGNDIGVTPITITLSFNSSVMNTVTVYDPLLNGATPATIVQQASSVGSNGMTISLPAYPIIVEIIHP